MAREIIDIGTVANDGTGDTLRNSFNKSNLNFEDLYAYTNNATTTALSLSTLNSTYTGVRVGYQVFCESISGGALVYIKSHVGWVSTPITVVV